MKKAIIASALALSSVLTPLAASARTIATGSYSYNRRVSNNLYVGAFKVRRVEDRNGGTDTKMTVTFTLPSCGSRYYLYGQVSAKYTSKTGNTTGWKQLIFTDSRSRNYEGSTLTRTRTATNGLQPRGGRVSIKNNLTCKSLAPLRDADREAGRRIRQAERDARNYLERRDPTKGIFW